MNLHDWIDELCDTLEVDDVDVDEGLLADLTETATRRVGRRAAPVATFLLGYAAAAQRADVEQVEALAARVQSLAAGWDQPAGAVRVDPPADEGDADYSDDLDLGADDPDDTDDADVTDVSGDAAGAAEDVA